jgi:hypothetical protein
MKKKGFTEELGNLQKAYEETIGTPINEAKKDKPLSTSKLKWADKRRKDIETSVDDLKDALSSGDKNALGATLMTMKSLIQVIEQGLDLKEIPGRRLK